MPATPRRRAAFVDRDGVINEELGYVYRIEDFRLLPGVIEGLRLLQGHDYRLVVVTNQAGIARGLYTEADFERVTTHMLSLFGAEGVTITGVYHCPHHPSAGVGRFRKDCDCRKPRPGMLLKAAAEHDLDLAESVLIGDKGSDIEAGRAAGVKLCVLVDSGMPIDRATRALADSSQGGLAEAARWIVEQTPAGSFSV